MNIKEEWAAEKEAFAGLVESIAGSDGEPPKPIEEDPEPEPQSDGDVITQWSYFNDQDN